MAQISVRTRSVTEQQDSGTTRVQAKKRERGVARGGDNPELEISLGFAVYFFLPTKTHTV